MKPPTATMARAPKIHPNTAPQMTPGEGPNKRHFNWHSWRAMCYTNNQSRTHTGFREKGGVVHTGGKWMSLDIKLQPAFKNLFLHPEPTIIRMVLRISQPLARSQFSFKFSDLREISVFSHRLWAEVPTITHTHSMEALPTPTSAIYMGCLRGIPEFCFWAICSTQQLWTTNEQTSKSLFLHTDRRGDPHLGPWNSHISSSVILDRMSTLQGV